MSRPTLHGAPYSVYVRIARLALEEKGVPYDLVPVDVFAPGGPPAGYLRLNPFGRIPTLVHAGFTLYETDAILRYLDEAFAGPPLTPGTPRERARMTQLMRILDGDGYRGLVWGLYVPEAGSLEDRDSARAVAAVAPARRCLEVLEGFLVGDFFLGDRPLLADLYAAPMLTYLSLAPTGRRLLRERPRLSAWLARMAARDSMAATRFPAEG